MRSPPRKRLFLDDDLSIVAEQIIQTIADNPELDDRLRGDYIAEYLSRIKKATTPQQLHDEALPYLMPLSSPDSRMNVPYYSSSSSSSSSLSSPSSPLSSPFDDEPTDEYFPMEMTSQKAHGTGVSRETPAMMSYTRVFMSEDLGYLDLHNTGQHYGPGVYQSQIYPSFISPIQPGFNQSQRQGHKVALQHLAIRLQIILPETQCTEASAGKLNDELRILVVRDTQPHPNYPTVQDVLSVHDQHHTINAFHNPATAGRFMVLYDTSFFMQYTTIWEYTRGGGVKMAQFLPVDMKESIDIDLSGHVCSFDPEKSGYDALVDYNLFAIFISARGIKLSSAIASDVKEAETFKVDWSARLVFK